MALIVSGPVMKGKLGGMSVFYNKRGQRIIRQPGGPSRQQIRTLASCAGMRDAIKEFSDMSAMAGAVRSTFGMQAVYFSDGTHFNRLMGLMRMVADTDTGHGRGERSVLNGNVYLLEDFQWNRGLQVKDAIGVDHTTSMDVAGGKMVLELGPFVPGKIMSAPAGATHFQVLFRGCVLEGKHRRAMDMKAGPVTRLDGNETAPLRLELDLHTEGVKDGLMLMGSGVIFYEEIEGLPFAMRGKGAFALAGVERVAVKQNSAEQRKSAIEMMEAAIGQCRMARRLGMVGVASDHTDIQAELVRVEKILWRKRLERLRGTSK